MYYYLASPFSHPDKKVERQRAKAVCRVADYLISSGLPVFSPIAHGWAIQHFANSPSEFAAWEKLSLAMIEQSKGVLILELPGWLQSTGVRKETEYASLRGKPVLNLPVKCTPSLHSVYVDIPMHLYAQTFNPPALLDKSPGI